MSVTYEGKVNNLITVEELRTLTGVTEGTNVIDGDITWLKFVDEGKEILVGDRPIIDAISWDMLNSHGVIYGKEIKIKNSMYKCRVLTGADAEPANIAGGEWDKYIVNLVPNDDISNWSGRFNWCQESVYQSTAIVMRGKSSVDRYLTVSKVTSSLGYSFRPVLELLYEEIEMPPKLPTDSTLLNTIDVAEQTYLAVNSWKDKLSYTLKNKGVEVTDQDKMSTLIDKVDENFGIRFAKIIVPVKKATNLASITFSYNVSFEPKQAFINLKNTMRLNNYNFLTVTNNILSNVASPQTITCPHNVSTSTGITGQITVSNITKASLVVSVAEPRRMVFDEGNIEIYLYG